jgi:hypothetical protein
MIFEAMVVGGLILAGLGWVSTSLDAISKQMRRANDLKEAEPRPKGGAVAAPGPASD